MSARSGGTVAVGLVGLILVLIGVLVVGLGVMTLYASDRYETMLADALDGPQPPSAAPLIALTAAAGVALAVVGMLIIWRRVQIVERWLLPPQSMGESEVATRGQGSVAAVGVAGLCMAVIGLSEVTGATVVGVSSGWDDEWTYTMWSGLPYLVVGVTLVLRPRFLSAWWKS